MRNFIPLIIVVIILFYGAYRKARKEKENKRIDIINKSSIHASASALNKNLKTGDALNFDSYDIPEYKGYHFEIGRGYVRNKRQHGHTNPATGLPMIGNVDAAGNPWGLGDNDDWNRYRRYIDD